MHEIVFPHFVGSWASQKTFSQLLSPGTLHVMGPTWQVSWISQKASSNQLSVPSRGLCHGWEQGTFSEMNTERTDIIGYSRFCTYLVHCWVCMWLSIYNFAIYGITLSVCRCARYMWRRPQCARRTHHVKIRHWNVVHVHNWLFL